MKTSNSIIIRDLSFTYPNRSAPTLDDISLNVKSGEFVLITGPTGCGKSTLLKTLNGIIPFASGGEMRGSVIIDGIDTQGSRIRELTPIVGLVFQNPDDQIFSTVVEDEVAFGPENLCLGKDDIRKRLVEALTNVDMVGYRKNRTNTLSGGQKQRVAMASTLSMYPSILALDEPFSQIDPKGANEVLQVINKLNSKGVTIILVEHRIHKVAHQVDRIIIMDRGKIVMDKEPKQAFEDLDLFYKLGLRVPETVELGHKLGLKEICLTVKETKSFLKNKIDRVCKKSADKRAIKKPKPVIECNRLYYWYEKKKRVLDDINLKIGTGEFVAIMGPNGCGKSTLLYHFAALLKPREGKALVLGLDTSRVSSYKIAEKVGFLFQNPDLMLFSDSVRDEVRFGPVHLKIPPIDIENRVDDALEAMKIEDLEDESPLTLSRGQRLRTAMGSILGIRPQILLLDEPTTGQDHVHISSLMDHLSSLAKNGSTVVFCTHDVETAIKYASRILIMNKGRIVADGDPQTIFKDLRLIRSAALDIPQSLLIGRGLGLGTILSVDGLREVIECSVQEP